MGYASKYANAQNDLDIYTPRKKLRKFYAKVACKMSNFCKKRPIFASEICPVLRIVCASFHKIYFYQNCWIRREICTELCENSHPTFLNLNCWKDCSLNFNRLFIYRMLCPIQRTVPLNLCLLTKMTDLSHFVHLKIDNSINKGSFEFAVL